MHARMTIIPTEPEQADRLLAVLQEQVLPQARQWDGFKGFVGLIDRQTGKSVTLTVWESEEAMRASEKTADVLRSDAIEKVGGAAPTVERYEVAVFEV